MTDNQLLLFVDFFISWGKYRIYQLAMPTLSNELEVLDANGLIGVLGLPIANTRPRT